MKPMSMDAEDTMLREIVPVEPAPYSMTALDVQRAKRARNAVRRYRQGQRFFRLYTSRGPRVEVLALEVKKGKAVVEGRRGVFPVALCDLRPDTN